MKIIIEGAGQVGSHLAKMLSHEGGDITVIDDNEARLQRLNATADVVTILGDPSSIKVLREAGCAKADLFIAVNPATTQTVNIVSALLAKRLGTKRVIARIDDEAYLLPENTATKSSTSSSIRPPRTPWTSPAGNSSWWCSAWTTTLPSWT